MQVYTFFFTVLTLSTETILMTRFSDLNPDPHPTFDKKKTDTDSDPTRITIGSTSKPALCILTFGVHCEFDVQEYGIIMVKYADLFIDSICILR